VLVERIAEDLGGGDVLLTYYQTDSTGYGVFTSTDTITGGTSGATGTVDQVNTPEVEAYSGDILYLENRRPIARASDQLEDIKVIIAF